ncbi:hypothetical protein J2S03_002692 [Alicyclobacillus cycloheptanicus]|uniref:Uncharacterized protein n=1 Tax=Alicyclobacillus cycloheptanicus TaxID=1457 RepID=A0ABT9XKJ6_9BACL|nr:hypothetical protein [Alicyclobacillus cycloheptanicus]
MNGVGDAGGSEQRRAGGPPLATRQPHDAAKDEVCRDEVCRQTLPPD